MVNRNEKTNKNCTAEYLYNIISEIFLENNLSFSEHIVAIIANNAATMKKLERLVEPEHLMCQAHAFHLAVGDLMFETFDYTHDINEYSIEENDFFESTNYDEIFISNNYNFLISKIRIIMKKFKKAHLKTI